MKPLFFKIIATVIVVATVGAVGYLLVVTWPHWGPTALDILKLVGIILGCLILGGVIIWAFDYFFSDVLPHKKG